MEQYIEELQKIADEVRQKHGSLGDLSDGYHTYNELYHHRALLFAAICNNHANIAWKSLQHHDPSEPMYDGMFIVGVETPFGQATYHYDIDPYWDLFKVPELKRAHVQDGHTPEQAVERIYQYFSKQQSSLAHMEIRDEFTKECDKYLKDPSITANVGVGTYYWIDTVMHCIQYGLFSDKSSIELTVPFRFPGATRGHIVIRPWSDGEIVDIVLYETACGNAVACYRPEVKDMAEQWKGRKLPKLGSYIRSMNGEYLDLTK